MAIESNACPTCNELAAHYGVAFYEPDLITPGNLTISLPENICNKLSKGMSVNLVNREESLIIIPLSETINIEATCAYILIGLTGSHNYGNFIWRVYIFQYI